MKKVTSIPEPTQRQAKNDPWFDALFDGNLYELSPEDWGVKYKSSHSAQSAIRQAGQARKDLGIDRVTVSQRGENLYVQAILSPPKAADNGTVKPKAPRKAATKATKAATKAPAKRASKATS